MSWYYSDSNNQRLGPIDETAFEGLAAQGQITPETLVWREGMANWLPYSQARGAATGGLATAPCAECGRSFTTSEMVQYENRFICPTCKPLFFQKVKEGAAITGDRVFAGFWIRFAAVFIDGILMQILGTLAGFVVGLMMSGDPQSAQIVAGVIGFIIGITYEVYFIGSRGATPGKMALKLQVIRADGTPPGYGVAAGRYFAKILSAIILLIGYIMAAFDEQKRGLHDRICDTRVVRV